MAILPDAGEIGRGLRDPLVLGGLLIGLLPILGVFHLGWGALALVILYWMENAAIGIATALRMLTIGAVSSRESLARSIGSAIFFLFHYGVFWLGHGIFIVVGAGLARGSNGVGAIGRSELAEGINGLAILVALAALRLAWELVLFGVDLARGGFAEGKIDDEATAPYTRLVVLHVGIVLSGFAAVRAGDPAAFTLAIILGYAAWTFVQDIHRRLKSAGPAL